MGDTIKIGVSANFMHADPTRAIFKGKTLIYSEHELLDYVMSEGALAVTIPPVGRYRGRDTVGIQTMVAELDGLLLQGGADVAPESYDESPIGDWKGDKVRDLYEIALIKAFMAARKPILGICRGLQIANVALGGTLYQDIATQVPGALAHRNWDIYDNNAHGVEIEPGSTLSQLYGGATSGQINSIHHQAIKDVAPGLVVEARSPLDNIVEAIRLPRLNPTDPYLAAVQWHPEFTRTSQAEQLDPRPLYQDFMRAVRDRRAVGG